MAASWNLSAGLKKKCAVTHPGLEKEMALTFAGFGKHPLLSSHWKLPHGL